MNRKSLIRSIMISLSALNPFSGADSVSERKKPRNPKSTKRYAKPPTKAKFKQNQRKQRNASARKKSRK